MSSGGLTCGQFRIFLLWAMCLASCWCDSPAQCSVLGTCLWGTSAAAPCARSCAKGVGRHWMLSSILQCSLSEPCAVSTRPVPWLLQWEPLVTVAAVLLQCQGLGLGTARAARQSSTRMCCLLSPRRPSQGRGSSGRCSAGAAVGHCAWEAPVLAYCALDILQLIFLSPTVCTVFLAQHFSLWKLQLGSY